MKLKFKGKSVNTGKWVKGTGAALFGKEAFIFPGKEFAELVDRKTVCQWIGIKDIKKRDIYTGDEVINITHGRSGSKYTIVSDTVGFIGISDEGDEYGPYTLRLYINDENPKLELVGNIHDNLKIPK